MANWGMGPYLVGIAFWVFVGAVSIAGIVGEHKKRRLGVELLRYAIEKGQTLEPAIIEKLMGAEARDKSTAPLDLKIAGIITIAGGAGVSVLAFFVRYLVPAALYPTLGAGLAIVCVGAGLCVASRAMVRSRERDQRETH
jgi:hypothetical protein